MKKFLNIQHLIYYIIMIYILGAVIGMINPTFYINYLSLDFEMIFKGQIWRLLTWVIYPKELVGTNILFFSLEIFFYYFTGIKSEEVIGTQKFNKFYFIGFLSNIFSALLIYFIFRIPYPMGIQYLNQSLFFLYAILFANNTILFMFILPIKVKWLGIAYAIFIGYTVIKYFLLGSLFIPMGIAILLTFINVFWFLFSKNKRVNKKIINLKSSDNTINKKENKCAICGSTEDIRFCSKCNVELCYCLKHIHNHEHK